MKNLKNEKALEKLLPLNSWFLKWYTHLQNRNSKQCEVAHLTYGCWNGANLTFWNFINIQHLFIQIHHLFIYIHHLYIHIQHLCVFSISIYSSSTFMLIKLHLHSTIIFIQKVTFILCLDFIHSKVFIHSTIFYWFKIYCASLLRIEVVHFLQLINRGPVQMGWNFEKKYRVRFKFQP